MNLEKLVTMSRMGVGGIGVLGSCLGAVRLVREAVAALRGLPSKSLLLVAVGRHIVQFLNGCVFCLSEE